MRKKPEREKSTMESLIASPVVKSFISGSLSGFTSTVVFQPFDLVKTRIQTAALKPAHVIHTASAEVRPFAKPSRISMLGVVIDVVKTERVRGLWKGVTPSVARTVPGVGLYFSVLHTVKAKLDITQPTAMQNLIIGGGSRTIAGSILLPFTVIKARYESGFFGYTGVTNAFFAIYRQEGVRGLWSGMCATVLRDAPFSGLYLMFYNQAKITAIEKRPSVAPWLPVPTLHFLCGIWAGFLASVVTQPPDVIKTHMQLNPRRHRKVTRTIVFVYRSSGFSGFFRGLVPRTMRRTLMAATAWTVYEQLMSLVSLK